jgi:hypothetical protein
MKTTISLFVGAAFFSATTQLHADILAGPITNPANGHDYYLLTPDTWTASEFEAEKLGGTLAIIENADEQKWVYSTFSAYGGANYNLWIGLHRPWPGAPLVWVTDEQPTYSNWSQGNPDNAGGMENCVEMYNPRDTQPGKWNDFGDNAKMGDPICGVVEVPGKSKEKSLTDKETSLVGTWYNNGDPAQPCNIAATDHLIFAIDQNNDASRLIYTPDGLLFSAKWKQHIIIAGDKILWSRGNWWSRQPVPFKTGDATSSSRQMMPMINFSHLAQPVSFAKLNR